ncbi:MAG: tRNA lysidine(34) synthetase TilS [Deltaproteobacteria bacterium]|nr:tRNA lysidine(34) synthetase TilS [Deltaproteobacteria bacterium]
MDLPGRVAAYARREGLLPRGAAVVAAVSGGLDSVVLLDVLDALRGPLGFRLSVATFDHGMRPGVSAEDTAFVRRLAAERGLVAHCGRRAVAPRGEEEARRERLAFLAGIAADRVALGHHRDDQAETVLLRLIRGTGLEGLVAMEPYRPPFVRPLLAEPRDALAAHAERRGLTWREDASNADPTYERNRIRHQVLPLLESLRTGAGGRLAALADLLRQDAAVLARAEQDALSRVTTPGGLDRVALDAEPRALQARLLRKLVADTRGSTRGLTARHLESPLDLVRRGRPGAHAPLPGGWRIVVDEDVVRCLPPVPQPLVLDAAGVFEWGIHVIRARTLPGDEPLPTLLVRPPRCGDRVGRTPLGEALRRRAVPPGLRPWHPVFWAQGTLAWAPPCDPAPSGPPRWSVTVTASRDVAGGGWTWAAAL